MRDGGITWCPLETGAVVGAWMVDNLRMSTRYTQADDSLLTRTFHSVLKTVGSF